MSRMRILILIQGSLGERLTGPEIRGWEMVQAFGERHEVTAAAGVPAATVRDGVPVVPSSRRSILRELRRHDAIVGPAIPPYALLAGRDRLRVADLYDPGELEMATVGGWKSRRHVAQQRAARRLQLRWADVVVGANERQIDGIRRDLAGIRRSAPAPTVNVPMGLPDPPGDPVGTPLRDRFEAIGDDDPVVLWWGSVWRWLDAHTAVEAIGMLAERRPDLRLVITAGRPPNASTDPLNVTEEVREFARERGLLGRHVFFLDEWVPFERRNDYLADADLAISLHADTPEAAVAARARYMDCVWSSLPLVLAAGDEVADRLAGAGAASLVPPRDAAAAAAAIDAMLEPARLAASRQACARVADEFRWGNLLAPLVERVEQSKPGDLHPTEVLRVAGQSGRYYLRRAVDRALSVG